MNRVVTGYDANGRPAIVRHGQPPTVIQAGRYTTTELWVTDQTPPVATDSDASARGWELEPPPRGTCFRIVEIAPGQDRAADGEPLAGGEPPADGEPAADREPAADGEPAAGDHEEFQGAHATATLDYVTVLSGQVTLIVGDTEVTLGPGDSVVQQPGVPHDWQNRSGDRAVMVGVLLSAR
jgi:naringenin degradation protein FdeH